MSLQNGDEDAISGERSFSPRYLVERSIIVAFLSLSYLFSLPVPGMAAICS